MRVAVGMDHGGYPLKQTILEEIRKEGHEPVDVGAFSLDPGDDYPDFARAVGEAIISGRAERGVLVCGSGVGASVAACKMKGIRASVCHDHYSAHQGVEHDNMNVLCLGARIIGSELAVDLIKAFLAATFSGEARHVRRLQKVEAMEAGK
ncbi:MAG TPA: ribose 5-phosphate isomerase B [Ktedonobacterales bacterium]|jgi:ribose 5-phosphate isomerase B